MAITLDSTIPRTPENTIDIGTPYSDVNIKSNQITEDMIDHLEAQIVKAETDFNTSVQADITAVTNAKDVAVTAASNANTSEINALSSKNSATASATTSYNSSVTSSTSASEALVSANNASTSETNSDVSEANALASASTATTASITSIEAKDITVPLANQVSIDAVATIVARDEALDSAILSTTNATQTAQDSIDTNLDMIAAELSAQNAEQSALIATDFHGYVGVWDSGTTYNTGDTVSFGRLIYACNLDGVVAVSPEHIQNTAEWFFLGRDHNKYISIVTDYIAEPNDYIIIEATESFTITLPVVHTLNDTITIYTGETSEEFNVIVDGNGDLFKRFSQEDTILTLDTNGMKVVLKSNGIDWRIL